MSTAFKQEMPPPNGYPPILEKRIRNYNFYGNYAVFTLSGLYTLWWIHKYRTFKDRRNLQHLEQYNCQIALQPFLEAERDRAYLKHVIHLRDEEVKTMSRFPEWVPGSLFGMSLYHMVHPEQHIRLNMGDYIMFRPMRDRGKYYWASQLSLSGG
ncbi:NADH dehydrogenase (ubiquinone) B16.6 subunit [Brevipalpus obovatus]|uniref:NADH dehydrogenase (ubiquinone) B16.6 subunit n=1 Tax=Brevipalpus obovatus TaxID=246614 RepID=UPI003D9F81DA